MRMSNEEYAAFVDSLSPRSPIWGDLLRAGLVGGAICVVGQALVNLYEHWGASAATAATWCSITLVFLGALLTGAFAERGIWVSCALLAVSFLIMFIREEEAK